MKQGLSEPQENTAPEVSGGDRSTLLFGFRDPPGGT